MRTKLVGLSLALVLSSTSVSWGDGFSDCFEEQGAVAILGCTDLIESGQMFGKSISAENLALVYNKRGTHQADSDAHISAIADYSLAIETDPGLANAYLKRGLAHYALARYSESVADNSAAIDVRPDYDLAYYNRALAHYRLGEYDNAIADNTSSLELVPEDALAYYNRALAYEKLGQNKQAIADFHAALAIDPTKQNALDGLARLGG
jgi:tetratricopeptide (TPR) repeat protein